MFVMMPYPGMTPFGSMGCGGPMYLVVPLPPGVDLSRLFNPGVPAVDGGAGQPGVTLPGFPGFPGFPVPGLPTGFPNLPGLLGSVVGGAAGVAGEVAGAGQKVAGDVLKGANEVLNQLQELMDRGLGEAKKERDRLAKAGEKAGNKATKELKDAISFAESRVKALEEGAKDVANAAGQVLGSLFGKK